MGEQADLIVDRMIDGWFNWRPSKRSAKGAVISEAEVRNLATEHLTNLLGKPVSNGSRARIKGELKRRRDLADKGAAILRKLRGET